MDKKSWDSFAQKQPCFFLGANSGEGFCNHFDEIYRPADGDRLYILKGGPGTGKSTFMKRLALAMEQQGIPCRLFYCSSDPRSLDGVSFPTLRAAVADGTAPHVMEAKYLGVSERIVNLGECLDMDALEQHRREIMSLYGQNKQLHLRASRFLNAAAQLTDDSFAVDCECSDLTRAEETAQRICKTLLPSTQAEGRETLYFLSGLTPDGPVLLEETLPKLADRIIAIEDEYGAVSSVMMSVIRNYALEAGHKIITCPCALSPRRKIDHVVLPDLKLAFCTVNWQLPITVDTDRRIHARRFRDASLLSQKKQRLRFNKRAAEELLEGACRHIFEARAIHDELEGFYIRAMDFDAADGLCKKTQQELLRRSRS